MKFQARPILTDKGIIYIPKDKFEDFKSKYPKLNNAILLKQDYSICIKIDDIIEDNYTKIPYITFNKYKKGSIQTNEEVNMYPFSSPVAKSCLVLLNDRYTVPEGDWGTKIINSSVEGEIFDYGDTMDFMYGETNPMLIQGTLKLSSPQAPIIIGPDTYFSVEKCDYATITKEEAKSHELKSKRAHQYSKLLEEQIFHLVEDIRRNAIDKRIDTSEFYLANPAAIFKSIKKILFNYKIISEDVIKESDTFIGSILAIPFSKRPQSLVEIIIFSNIKKGNITVSAYSTQQGMAHKIVETEINPLLPNIIDGLKETTQLLYDFCAGCNGKLQLSSQDERGIVRCHLCKTLNQLPIDLRNNIEIATLDVIEDEFHSEINDLVIKEVEMFLLNINPGIQVSLDQISKKLGIKLSNVKTIISKIISINSDLGEYIEEIDSFLRKKADLKANPEDFTNFLKEMEERKRKRKR